MADLDTGPTGPNTPANVPPDAPPDARRTPSFSGPPSRVAPPAEGSSLRAKLLTVNHAYNFFGASLYVGVLWALHFFWYPTWTVITADNYYDQFIPPTDAATRFFTIVVPLMFLASAIMIWSEWRTRFRWVAVLTFLCIAGATYVGTAHIIPINRILATRITDQAQLTAHFRDWMMLNDIRMAIVTVMWLTLMYFFVAKGRLLRAIDEDRRS
ncbi:MAG: hypothetical protein M3373_09000 [Gemmatimonadota bacterium]|nr:hypothetical protein [Gemmatimonadota bacterium]